MAVEAAQKKEVTWGEVFSMWTKELLPTWVLEYTPLIRTRRRLKRDPIEGFKQKFFPRHVTNSAVGDETIIQSKPQPRGLFGQRKLTPEEIDEIKRQREADRLRRRQAAKLQREARNYIRIIQDTLERRGVSHTATDSKGHRKVSYVKFHSPPNINPHFIELYVDTYQWPHGCNLDQLEDPSILDHISINCKHRVRERRVDRWCVFTIELDVGATGIPLRVEFDDMLKLIPASRANDNLLMALGKTENGRPVFVSLPRIVNMKVSGSPDSGKSNFINAIILWLVERNRPDQLQLMLIDLKGGVEFAKFYEGLPHLMMVPPMTLHRMVSKKQATEKEDEASDDLEAIIKKEKIIARNAGEPRPAIVEERDDLPGALYWIVQECERRFKAIKKVKAKNIGEYNQIAHNVPGMRPMPRLLLIVDELADVLQDDEVKEYARRFLENITNRGRSVGVHAIVCSQATGRDLLQGRIQQAFRALATFALADRYVSISTVGNQSASKIPDNPGRFIWTQGRYELEIQAPYCPNSLVEQIVAKQIANGGAVLPSTKNEITEQDIFEWALEHNNGMLGVKEVFNEFRTRGLGLDKIKAMMLKSENTQVIIDETVYQIMPAVPFPHSVPRRLLAVAAEVDSEDSSPTPESYISENAENSTRVEVEGAPLEGN